MGGDGTGGEWRAEARNSSAGVKTETRVTARASKRLDGA